MVLSDRDAMSQPVLSPQTQTRPPPVAVSHPSVDAATVPDRVQALDDFVQQELLPKVLRLREEHQSIDQQLQRTRSTTTSASAASKQNQAQRLKQQAWLWKRTSKRQELNRIEPFLELATDLQTLSQDLNPNLLRRTALWQQSQAGATNTGHGGRHEEGQRLSRDYRTACRENAELSKSIQARIDRLIPPTSTTLNNKEDASIVASLRIFCNNNLVCGTCQAMFHKDYLNALVVPAPNDHTTAETAAALPTFVCFPCWHAKARGQRKETDDLFGKAFSTKNFVVKPLDDETTNTTNTNDNNKENNTLPTPPMTTSSSQIQKNPMHESERWKARKAVIKNRMVAAATATANANASKGKSSSRAGVDNRSVTTDASTVDDSVKSKDSPSVASQAFDHYIDSMSTLDDGLLRIGKSMSKCSKFVLGDDIGKGSRKLPPLLHHLSAYDESTRTNRLDAMKLQMNSSAVVVDTNKDAKGKPNERQPNRSWSRYGSSTSSICSNSIVESEGSFNSRIHSDSSTTRYEMSDGSLVQQLPVKRNDDSWNRVSSPDSSMCSGSSLFSDSSTDASLLTFLTAESSSEPHGRKFLKSAMKTKKASTMAYSTNRASPTKVQDFPFGSSSSSSSSHSRKSVRFRSPLTECKVFNPMAADNSNKALLDTSADIMDHMKYFCKWETFLNPFEQKAA